MSFTINRNSVITCNGIEEKTGNANIAGYIRLEYIQSAGAAEIDTGYADGLKVTVDCHMSIGAASGNYWFGSQQAHGSMMYNGPYNQSALEYNWLTVSRTASNELIMTQRLVGSNTVININGVTSTVATGTEPPTGNMWICGCNGGARPFPTTIKCYYFKMYDNNVLVRDYIPVKRISDNKVGLYDLANGVFYPSSKSTDFTAGPELYQEYYLSGQEINEW